MTFLNSRKEMKHNKSVDGGGKRNKTIGSTKLERYRIPPKLIEKIFVKMTHKYQLGHDSNKGIYKKYRIPPNLIESMFKVI